MGRVAFDPGELLALAGQLTSAGGSLLGIQGQVVGAAADPGLLPSGAGMAAQAVAAVAGLVGAEASLVNTAGQIAATATMYEEAMAASGALPVFEQTLTQSPLTDLSLLSQGLSTANNFLNGIYAGIGGWNVDAMNWFATETREGRTPLSPFWPEMQQIHNFLGQSTVRLVLQTVSTVTSAISTGLAIAAIAVDVAGGGPEDPFADALSIVLLGAGCGVTELNLGANLALAAGGDESTDVRTNVGSDEAGLASADLSGIISSSKVLEADHLGQTLDAVTSPTIFLPLYAMAEQQLSGELPTIKTGIQALGSWDLTETKAAEQGVQAGWNTEVTVAKATLSAVPSGATDVQHAIQAAPSLSQLTVQAAESKVKSGVQTAWEWLQTRNPNPVPLPHAHW